MKTISADAPITFRRLKYHDQQTLLATVKSWIKEQEPLWEYNRLGISTTGIFIQVTVAAAMIAILALSNASPWIYGIGISLAFIANSIAFAQSPMRWVLGLFTASITVNLLLSLFYGTLLLVS